MFVKNMTSSRTGNEVANQFVLFFSNAQVFQSYKTIIAMIDNTGKLWVTPDWEASKTTMKYFKEFANTTASAKEIRGRIEEGRYKMCNANDIRAFVEGKA